MITISTDKSKLQIEVIQGFLTTTYWAKGRTIDEVKKNYRTLFMFWCLF
jgi:hypothetical protein